MPADLTTMLVSVRQSERAVVNIRMYLAAMLDRIHEADREHDRGLDLRRVHPDHLGEMLEVIQLFSRAVEIAISAGPAAGRA